MGVIVEKKYSLMRLNEVNSTQIVAKDMLYDTNHDLHDQVLKTLDNGKIFAINANSMSAGIGQHGRSWHAPQGNVYLTSILKLPQCNIINLPQVFAILVHDILKEFGINTKIKWVNDLLYYDSLQAKTEAEDDNTINRKLDEYSKRYRKICGVLCEVVEYEKKKYLILGIGVNVAASPDDAVCISDILPNQYMPTVDTIVDLLCNNMQSYLDEFVTKGMKVYQEIMNENAAYLNKNVRLTVSENSVMHGIFRGYNDQGFIMIETNGTMKTYWSGRLSLDDTNSL